MESLRSEEYPETGTQYMKLKNGDELAKKTVYKWSNIYWLIISHLITLVGFFLIFTSIKGNTILFAFIIQQMCVMGVAAGVHRMWCHRTFKGRLPIRILLMLWSTMSFVGSIYDWTRDHRVHHKHSDTDADPHNSRRGFFYSHIGWLMYKKSPEVIQAGKAIDLSDLEADPVVMFQKKHYLKMMPLLTFVLPTICPVYFWGESWTNAFVICIMRLTISIHILGITNSFAHMFGNKPYDKSMSPANNIWVWMMTIEGLHNYHHVFPWDYRASDLPLYNMLTPVVLFIEAAAWIGQAYDLKTVTPEMVKQRALKTGDGHYTHIH